MSALIDVLSHPVQTLEAFPENLKLAAAGVGDAVNHYFGGHSTMAASVVATEEATAQGKAEPDPERLAELRKKEIEGRVVETAARKTAEDLTEGFGQLFGGLALAAVAIGGGYLALQFLVLRHARAHA